MAQRWDPPFDPDELKDFGRDWSDEMAKTGDTLKSATWVLPDEATAATLRIATSYISNATLAIVWFQATDPDAFGIAFAGKEVAISHTITTNGGRTLHETCFLKVRDK